MALAACATRSPEPASTTLVAEPEQAIPAELSERERCDEVARSIECSAVTKQEVVFASNHEDGPMFCEVRCMLDELPDGPFAHVDVSTGEIEDRGRFEAGEPVGTWLRWGRNSETLVRVKLEERTYRAGKLHGPQKRWHDNGQLEEEGVYLDDAKDGIWRTFGPDGAWTYQGEFDRGVQVGLHRERYRNGQMASQRAYDEVGRPHGEWCFWKADATVIECFTIEFGTGEVREYDHTGALTKRYTMRDGDLHGLLVEHVVDGSRYEANYEDGQQHGVERVLSGACVERFVTWSRGVEEGPSYETDCNAEPPVRILEGERCAGERCGRWIRRRHGTGLVMEVTEYTPTGKIVGGLSYDEAGHLIDFWGSVTP